MVRAGNLRRRLTLQSRAIDRDDRGGAIESWSTTATVWGSVIPSSGREAWQAEQSQAQVTHQVTIRYRAGVTPRMRLLDGSRVLHIASAVDVDSRKRELTLMCVEEV
jgi:SPP1 family predicted phage head-tail adaptor